MRLASPLSGNDSQCDLYIATTLRNFGIFDSNLCACYLALSDTCRSGTDEREMPDLITTYTRWQPWLGQVSIRSNLQDLWQEVDNTKT
jgi:hypothetical protein